MLSKNTIKYLNSLKEKKYRDLKNEFIVEGEKSVYEFLKYPENIKAIYALPAWINQNIEKLKLINNINEISVDLLKKISNLKTPNNVIAIVKKTHSTIDFNHNNLILVLDGIRDPGNIGTIIRIADWFGIDYLICSPDTVDPYNPKAVQSSMGSLCRSIRITSRSIFQYVTSRFYGIWNID